MGDLRRLIAFDLDGTLIDSRRDLADSANQLIIELGGEPLAEEAIGRMVGEGAAVLVRRALTAAGLAMDGSSLTRFLELYDAMLLRTTRPYPGVVDALETVHRDAMLALLTNKPRHHTQRLLDALELAPFFATIVAGDDAFPRKPDPRGFQHLMAHHGVTSRQTVLVGDSQIDAETARAARSAFCLAAYGFGARTLGGAMTPDAEVQTPAGIPGAVTALLSR